MLRMSQTVKLFSWSEWKLVFFTCICLYLFVFIAFNEQCFFTIILVQISQACGTAPTWSESVGCLFYLWMSKSSKNRPLSAHGNQSLSVVGRSRTSPAVRRDQTQALWRICRVLPVWIIFDEPQRLDGRVMEKLMSLLFGAVLTRDRTR